MTNEEAIKYLIAPIATSTDPGAEYLKQKEAYEMAIKALETGEVYMTGEDYNLYMEGYKSGLSDGRKDAERPKGGWKHYHEVLNNNTFYVTSCPFCKLRVKEETNFCQNCGADMRGKEE